MKKFLLFALTVVLFSSTAYSAEMMASKFTFENEGSTLSGTMYLPSTYRAGDKLPAVVVTGAWTTVQQ